LLEVLGLRNIDPDLPGRVAVVVAVVVAMEAAEDCGMTTRVVFPLRVTLDFSGMLTESSIWLGSRMLPCPVGDGNWANLKSVEADSRLLWRSSKLTEGKKSKEVVVSPKSFEDEGSFRRRENSV